MGNSTFRKLWKQLVWSIVIGRPMTDLCWQCQQNNHAIYRSSNLPECVKHAKLRKQEEHLRVVALERTLYKKMVDQCKEMASNTGVRLGQNEPCSREITAHYSFDFAQKVCLNQGIFFWKIFEIFLITGYFLQVSLIFNLSIQESCLDIKMCNNIW